MMQPELTAIDEFAAGLAVTPPLAHVGVPALTQLDPAQPANFYDRVPFERPGQATETALIEPDSGRLCTYGELAFKTARASGFLARRRLGRGAVVAAIVHDGIDATALMLACFRQGAVFAPLNYMLAPAAIARMVDQIAPDLLVLSAATESLVDVSHAPALHRQRLEIIVEAAQSVPDAGPASLSPDTPAVILFSSGSTGSPKPVVHTHGDLIHTNLNYVPNVIGLRAGERIFSPSRMFFAYGLNAVLFALFAGNSCVLASHPSKRLSVFHLLREYRVNVFFSVPTVFKFMLQDVDAGGGGLPDLRLCVSAGESLPAALHAAIRLRLGTEILDGIGTTEVLSTFISNRIGDRSGTGTVVPGFEVKLVGEDRAMCRAGEVGTLWVRGLTVARGYLDDAPRTAAGFEDGWYNTNDMFWMDEAQHFHYFGRCNDVVKINGCWFSPCVIEEALHEHPQVQECEISFVPDELGLLRPHASVVLRDAGSESDALWSELRQFARERLGATLYPHFFARVDRLLRTSSGKLIRKRGSGKA
jgi:acyl-coenzyme A synthetase/AMP-(fatty) acid ligase